MLSVDDAQTEILRHSKPLLPHQVELGAHARGRVLAETMASDLDLPPFNKAMMDGFAVRSSDCVAAGALLIVVEEVTAGRVPGQPVGRGEATRIMTGAPVPNGADAVVMVEQCRAEAGRVAVNSVVRPGQNIQPQGREVRRGEAVLSPGDVLRPPQLAMLATVGRTEVLAYPRPRVAVLTTGDEIVEPVQVPAAGQIRNSNGPMLLAQAACAGCDVRSLGIGRDNRDDLARLISDGLGDDVLVLSGGVSAGKLDLVPDVLQDLGVTPHFHKVAMKPGKPLLFGTRGPTLVYGLPGNPVSSFVCFELFVRPAVRAMGGLRQALPAVVRLPLAVAFRQSGDRPTYHPARVESADVGEQVRPVRWLGSADLRGLCAANALAVFAAGENDYEPGDAVPVVRLPD